MIKKIAYWIGENQELNQLCRDYIRQYSRIPDWDVVLFTDSLFQEKIPKYPSYTMYDYDGLIVVDSIEKLSKTEKLFGAKSLFYVWEDNWGSNTNFFEKLRLLGSNRIITRNNIESDKFKSIWGITPMSTALYPEPKELYNAAI